VSDLLPFIVTGLTAGAVYGLAAVGLVLTYKTSGVFNFAHGAMATVAAYAFYALHISHGVSWPVAALVCIVIVGPAMGLVLELLARAVGTATLEARVAATVGVLLIVEAAVVLIYGSTQVRTVPVFLPSGHFKLFGTAVGYADVITFGVAVVATAVLSAILRLSRSGLAMRAVVEDPALLDLAGTSPVATRRLAWCIGAGLAAMSGVLFAPLLPLDPVHLTLLVVQAFGAAAIGRFTSLPFSFLGGLIIGVLASVATKYFDSGLLGGVPSALPFLALFVVLLVLPRRFLVERSRAVQRRRSDWTAPGALQLGSGVLVLAGLACVPLFAGIHLTDWTTALAMVIVFLSLGLLVRTSGQVSLCHVAFTAIGAAGLSHLTTGAGLPWLPALVVSGLIAVPIGALLSIPAIRLSGLYLALATFGFGVVLQVMFYTQGYMFGATGAGLSPPRPDVFGLAGDTRFYELVLAIAALATLFVVAANRGRLGRLLRGMADSPTALRTNGVTVDVTRVLVFCISAFMAAIGGALAGAAQLTVSADSYPPLLSVTYFAVIVIVVGGEPWYALLAAGALTLVPSYLTGGTVATWLQMIFGVAAVLTAVATGRIKVPAAVRSRVDAIFRRPRPVAEVATQPVPADRVEPTALQVADLTVRYGGVVAVGGLTLDAPTGRITGLIGPNGAGKTTTFNACSGLVRASGGGVRLRDRDVSRVATEGRARLGLGRTFQQMQLFDSLTVGENVAIGMEGTLAGANPVRHLLGRRGDRHRTRAAASEALRLCELDTLADARVGDLSTGQRRLVELARCLAGPYRILLLDEPSSGLDHAESARFGQILRRVVAERGVGVLLVEHDMSLVLEVCDDIYVLDFGRPLFHGPPAEVQASPLVQAAYLGDPDVEDSAVENVAAAGVVAS
jgi:ABC-type branched-subunit amino acid transport system ATPase component/branched-subunit amino acid ABC-type transport system permease component